MAMRADLPHLEGGAWFYSGIATVMRGLKQEDPWEAIFVTLRDDVRELISTDERIISVIVEKFKWSVPL
jgi:hypothetical protein